MGKKKSSFLTNSEKKEVKKKKKRKEEKMRKREKKKERKREKEKEKGFMPVSTWRPFPPRATPRSSSTSSSLVQHKAHL